MMKMTVINPQTALTAYYERRGFQRRGEHIPFPKDIRNGPLRDDLDLIVLRKSLTA